MSSIEIDLLPCQTVKFVVRASRVGYQTSLQFRAYNSDNERMFELDWGGNAGNIVQTLPTTNPFEPSPGTRGAKGLISYVTLQNFNYDLDTSTVTVIKMPRYGYNRGGDIYSNAPQITDSSPYYGSLDWRETGQYFKLRLAAGATASLTGYARRAGVTIYPYSANFRITRYNSSGGNATVLRTILVNNGSTVAFPQPGTDPITITNTQQTPIDYVVGLAALGEMVHEFELVVTGVQEPTCGDERDTMSNEYKPGVVYAQGVNPRPACTDFEQHSLDYQYSTHFTWNEWNGRFAGGNPHTGFGLLTASLVDSIEAIRTIYGYPIWMSSGYRPHGNLAEGGATGSRHMHGRATDLYRLGGHTPPYWSLDEFNALKAIAEAHSPPPDESFDYTTYADRHYHVAF